VAALPTPAPPMRALPPARAPVTRQPVRAGLHSSGDDLSEVVAGLDRVDILENLVPAELAGKPVE
jgi:hypothetical protein